MMFPIVIVWFLFLYFIFVHKQFEFDLLCRLYLYGVYLACSDYVLDLLGIHYSVSSACKPHILLCEHQRKGWGLG